MAEIVLSGNRGVAVVDDADLERLARFNWVLHPGNYAFVANPTLYMHRLIMSAPADLEVDHIDGNGLNNRRTNLRLATRSQNERNKPGISECGFRGVTRNRPDRGGWRAEIYPVGKKRVGLGSYGSPEEAAAAYDRAALEMYGEFAHLNFPNEDIQ